MDISQRLYVPMSVRKSDVRISENCCTTHSQYKYKYKYSSYIVLTLNPARIWSSVD